MRFQFKKGDRVDFHLAYPNGTPGTIRSRVTTLGYPAYRVDWDDGYDDRADGGTKLPLDNIWPESDLIRICRNLETNHG